MAGISGFIVYRFGLTGFIATSTFAGIFVAGAAAIATDVLFRQKKIAVISAIFIGLLVGLVVSNFIMLAVVPFLSLLLSVLPEVLTNGHPAYVAVNLATHSTVCYLCVSFLLQTRGDFRFIIPYIEFAKESKGQRPLLLDTSVIIDGRIADLSETRLFDTALVVPAFVLQELQLVADSSDKLKRNRGRRGLDVLNKLRANTTVDLQTNDLELPEFQTVRGVDQRLVLLARHLNAKIVTNDFNLNKLARVQGVDVVNLNDIANALKPVFLPGESIVVRLSKLGDQPGQAVGYLDDGTMVVAEQGKSHVGEEVRLMVTSVLQTSAGRMIFGRLDGQVSKGP
jgi:uncharacterized protein YacL